MARLLFVSHSADLGAGSSQSLLKLLKYIRDYHEVAVVTSRTGALQNVLRQKGIPHYLLRRRIRYFIPSLAYLIMKGNFDLVYGNNLSSPSLYALWAAKLTRRPFLWHVREVVRSEKWGRRLRRADTIIAISNASAKAVWQYLPDKEVTVIHNGVDLGDFLADRLIARQSLLRIMNLSNDPIIVINVGRVCNQKNQIQAIEAMAPVVRKYPASILCLLGSLQETSYASRLEERAASLGIANNVYLAGFQQNVNNLVCGADLLLHTSRKEAHGRVILEAMASRLPVVAFDVGGISESIVQGETGFLIPFGDLDAAAFSMMDLIGNPLLRQRLGRNGHRRVERLFTAEKTALRVNEAIHQTLQM